MHDGWVHERRAIVRAQCRARQLIARREAAARRKLRHSHAHWGSAVAAARQELDRRAAARRQRLGALPFRELEAEAARPALRPHLGPEEVARLLAAAGGEPAQRKVSERVTGGGAACGGRGSCA